MVNLSMALSCWLFFPRFCAHRLRYIFAAQEIWWGVGRGRDRRKGEQNVRFRFLLLLLAIGKKVG